MNKDLSPLHIQLPYVYSISKIIWDGLADGARVYDPYSGKIAVEIVLKYIFLFFFGTNLFWTLVTILPLWATSDKMQPTGSDSSLYRGVHRPQKEALEARLYLWASAAEKHTDSKPRAILTSLLPLKHKHACRNAHTHGHTHAHTHARTCTLLKLYPKEAITKYKARHHGLPREVLSSPHLGRSPSSGYALHLIQSKIFSSHSFLFFHLLLL